MSQSAARVDRAQIGGEMLEPSLGLLARRRPSCIADGRARVAVDSITVAVRRACAAVRSITVAVHRACAAVRSDNDAVHRACAAVRSDNDADRSDNDADRSDNVAVSFEAPASRRCEGQVRRKQGGRGGADPHT